MRRGLIWSGTLVALWVAGSFAAQQSPYVGLEIREIKSLSPQEVASYVAGEGMGLALAAELNGYPGPKHVLDLEKELQLSQEQLAVTERVFAEMRSAAVELGAEIVDRERQLDRLFAEQRISERDLESLVAEIARLQGQLRAVHLRAHLRMVDILSADQRKGYASYRGYHAAPVHERRDHHGAHQEPGV